VAIVLLVALIVVMFILVPMHTWFRALMSGAHISMFRLVGMKLRKVDYKEIVNQYILARKAGIKIYDSEIETHMMAGGNVEKVIDALIAAHSAKLNLSIEEAMAIDLAGRDVVLAVQTSVKPRVIKTDRISAIAKDGIEVKVIAQDLAGDHPIDITRKVRIEGNRLIIPGKIIRKIGLMNATPGDLSAPGMVIKMM
jgi:uncharacterized protein YqfA (UPF0365 family)